MSIYYHYFSSSSWIKFYDSQILHKFLYSDISLLKFTGFRINSNPFSGIQWRSTSPQSVASLAISAWRPRGPRPTRCDHRPPPRFHQAIHRPDRTIATRGIREIRYLKLMEKVSRNFCVKYLFISFYLKRILEIKKKKKKFWTAKIRTFNIYF